MDTGLLDAERKRADKLEAELVLLRREMAEARLLNQEREQSQGSLLRQWHPFDVALSNTPDLTYIFDLEGRFTYINRALLALWQESLEESVGKNSLTLSIPNLSQKGCKDNSGSYRHKKHSSRRNRLHGRGWHFRLLRVHFCTCLW